MTPASVVMPVLIRHEWQYRMTVCALETLACTTAVPFELVIVETEGKWLLPWVQNQPGVKYHHIPERANPNRDANCGISLCTSPKIVYTGNDVFVRPGWLEALLEVFSKIPDCGVATLASADLRHRQSDNIAEGAYGPFMMFDRGHSFDAENFPSSFGDTDLIMRLYKAGKRSYRNFRVVIEHLNGQTINGPSHQADFQAALQRFKAKHADAAHLLAYRLFTEGVVW